MNNFEEEINKENEAQILRVEKSIDNSLEKAINKKIFDEKERENLSKKGQALPDGSFPIRNTQDLKDAVKSIGRAKDYGKARSWIIKRARALGKLELLPKDWSIHKSMSLIKGAFEAGSISEEMLEKAMGHKYFKREGTSGKYKYYYTEKEYKEAKGSKAEDKNKEYFFERGDSVLVGSSKTRTLEEITGKSMHELKKLKTLNLDDKMLTEFPIEIVKLKKLKTLNLDETGIKELPKEIGQMKNLKILTLSYNKLTLLPKEIGQMKNLEELSLYNNHLTSIPKEIGQLKNLEYLHLSGNHLTSIPKEIGQLKNLEYLHLSGNHLTSIPKEIGQLKNLIELYINNNKIKEIPKEIKGLPDLKIIN